jgi:hypothetical protein
MIRERTLIVADDTAERAKFCLGLNRLTFPSYGQRGTSVGSNVGVVHQQLLVGKVSIASGIGRVVFQTCDQTFPERQEKMSALSVCLRAEKVIVVIVGLSIDRMSREAAKARRVIGKVIVDKGFRY